MGLMSERESTKRAIVNPEGSDPELTQALTESEQFKLERFRLESHHQLEMKQKEIDHAKANLGWIGHLIGDRKQAPVSLAFLAVVIGGGTMLSAYYAAPPDLFAQMFGGGLSLVTGALGYVFGRGKK